MVSRNSRGEIQLETKGTHRDPSRTLEEVTAINDANDKLRKLLENEDLSIDDLKNGIDELAKASQSFAEKLYAEAQNDTANPSSDESDDVVEGEVIEDE